VIARPSGTILCDETADYSIVINFIIFLYLFHKFGTVLVFVLWSDRLTTSFMREMFKSGRDKIVPQKKANCAILSLINNSLIFIISQYLCEIISIREIAVFASSHVWRSAW